MSFTVRRWKQKQRHLCFSKVTSERFSCISQNRHFPPATLDAGDLVAALVLRYLASPPLRRHPVAVADPGRLPLPCRLGEGTHREKTQHGSCFISSPHLSFWLTGACWIGQLADEPPLPLLMDGKPRCLSRAPSDRSGSSPFCQTEKRDRGFSQRYQFLSVLALQNPSPATSQGC